MEDKRKLGCAGLFVSVLATLFCLTGVMQAGWLSATPDYPPEQTRRNLWLWGTLTVVSLVMLCASLFILYRERKKRD